MDSRRRRSEFLIHGTRCAKLSGQQAIRTRQRLQRRLRPSAQVLDHLRRRKSAELSRLLRYEATHHPEQVARRKQVASAMTTVLLPFVLAAGAVCAVRRAIDFARADRVPS